MVVLRGGDDQLLPGGQGAAVHRVEALDPLHHRADVAVVGEVGGDRPEGVAGADGDHLDRLGLAGEILDTAWETIGTDLGYKPADPIRVELLGAPSDLAKLSPLTEAEIETTGTIALSKYNKRMVVSPRATIFGYPWMDTLAHEYTHLIVSRISQDTVPVWLQEGLARFEQALL